MSKSDDHTGPVPAPTAPADPAEKVQAERFGALVSTLVGGAKLPPAMDPDDRMLLDVAAMIRAGAGEVSLSQKRARQIAGDAIALSREGKRPPSISTEPEQVAREGAEDELLQRRRSRIKVVLPWTVTVVAAAAAALMWITRPTNPITRGTSSHKTTTLSELQLSRPADPVVGIIARADAHRASARIDAIYADRLDGYRSLTLMPASERRTP